MVTTFNGVADRPTPSTDQLFAVGVTAYSADKKPGLYYVPPNSLVIGKTDKESMVTTHSGAKRRAKHNPVYQVTANSTEATGANAFKTGNWRVFGIAYDGIDVANAQNAQNHPDSCGRFSVIFSGAATISAPHTVTGNDGDAKEGYQEKTIGTVVVANPYKVTNYQFRGDHADFRPIALGYIQRQTWLTMLNNPNQANVDACWDEAGLNAPTITTAADRYIKLAQLKVGYILDTGGSRRNEIRVQLSLNHGYFQPAAATGVASSFVDVDSSSIEPSTSLESAFIDCAESVPALENSEGCAEGSLLGVIANAVAPSGNVGTLDNNTLTPGQAGAIMSQASRKSVGLGPDGSAVPGTLAGELTMAGGVDPDSASKIVARSELLQALNRHEVPDVINGYPSNDVTVNVTPVMTTSLGECPSSVLQSHAIHSADGSVSAPHPMWVTGNVGGTTPVTSAAPGSSLDIYGQNPNAKAFAKQVEGLIQLARKRGVAIHKAPPPALQKFVIACQNELHK